MSLQDQHCIPCESGEPTATDDEIADFLAQVPDWSIREVKAIKRLTKAFRFKDFADAIAFVNRVKDVAEREGHHPDLHISWNRVRVENWTHAIKGLHENDFILAAKIDAVA